MSIFKDIYSFNGTPYRSQMPSSCSFSFVSLREFSESVYFTKFELSNPVVGVFRVLTGAASLASLENIVARKYPVTEMCRFLIWQD